MSEVTTSDLKLWIDKMMKTKNITEYKLDVGGSSEKGDGYLGEVTFLTVVTPKQDYHLVVKSAKKSDELRKQTPIKEAYDRESFFYSKIFPILEEFQLLKAIEKPFVNVPKCYSVSYDDKKEAIILQNLKSLGFELHDRKTAMNLNHIHKVFVEYGRFHALSLALRDQKPSVFKSVTKNMNDVLGKFVIQGQMLKSFEHGFEDVKKLLADDPEILKKYEDFDKQFVKILCGFSNENDPSSVILQGDCWNNNFMFEYEGSDKTKPADMRFLDFQLSRVASPVIDLSYFLYLCADKQVLKDFDFILQAYHSSLSDFLHELGSNVDDILPLKLLQDQWKTYGKFGLVMALFVMKIAVCDSNEAPDFAASAEKGEGFGGQLSFEIKNQETYERRIKDIYIHFAEKFL